MHWNPHCRRLSVRRPSAAATAAHRAKSVIARKVIYFLRLVEERTAYAEEG